MKRAFVFILAVLTCLALAACGAQPEEEMYYEEIPVNALPMRDTTVYFTDDSGYLVPVTVQVEWSQEMREEALALLTAKAPQGLRSLLPEGTAAALYTNGDTVVIDLPATAFEAQTAQEERNKVAAVVNTLTGFAQTERVIITVDGVSSVTLPHGTELSGAFSEFALNPAGDEREYSAVAYLPYEDDSHIVPVTLYFDEQPEIPDVLAELAKREFDGLKAVLGDSAQPTECVVDSAGNLTLSFAGMEEGLTLSEIEFKSLYLTCLAFDNVTDIDILVDGADVREGTALPTFANVYATPEE